MIRGRAPITDNGIDRAGVDGLERRMKLTFESRVSATADDLWRFHQSATALKTLTPWPIRIELIGDGTVKTGALHEIVSKVGLVRNTWVARIETATEPTGFIDVAERSPFRRWRHQHEFEDGLLRDVIDFEAGNAARTWIASLMIRALFAFRHARTRRTLEAKARD